MMLQGEASAGIMLDRSLDFWRNRDITAEAANMIKNGDRHSLSVQRIRNIEEHIKNYHEFSLRWSRQIYPHMTSEALQGIIQKPSETNNVGLAKSILAKRGITKPMIAKASNSSQATPSIAQRLKTLHNLLANDLLTEKEYRSKRKNILDEL